MSNIVGRDHSSQHSSPGRNSTVWDFFRTFRELVRNHGFKGLIAIAVAALFAFAPLTLLYWLNELRFESVLHSNHYGPVVVKAGQFEEDQEREEPGETALLQVTCETLSFGEKRPLLMDGDPRRNNDADQSTSYVNRERAYIRPANVDPAIPFALLGKPPVSVWLPAGDYEVLIVHEAPASEPRDDGRLTSFPLVSVREECKLENKQKTVCRVLLPHYGFNQGFEPTTSDLSAAQDRSRDEQIAPLLAAWENLTAVPTPAGYVLALSEPALQHNEEHRGCTIAFENLQSVPREWTRDQLASVRNWLPESATAARAPLSSLIDAIGWRELLEGWYCYAAAGVTGLVFTRWGAIAMLEPWRRDESFMDNAWLLCKVLFIAICIWFLFLVLTDSSSCSGPVRFRMH
jgi:hypothetical protein